MGHIARGNLTVCPNIPDVAVAHSVLQQGGPLEIGLLRHAPRVAYAGCFTDVGLVEFVLRPIQRSVRQASIGSSGEFGLNLGRFSKNAPPAVLEAIVVRATFSFHVGMSNYA